MHAGRQPEAPSARRCDESPGATAAGATARPRARDVIPEETAGPFPGDGTNGPDVLSESGVVRGHPVELRQLVDRRRGRPAHDPARGPRPRERLRADGRRGGLRLALRPGRPVLALLAGVEDENYLRGVQAAGADGIVTFTSIFPACYPGRWPHIHFEVYPSLDAATDAGNNIATSQIALPEDVCDEVYATAGYEQSVQNIAGVSLERDGVFGEDGGVRQLGTISGSVADGLTVDLAVPVQA